MINLRKRGNGVLSLTVRGAGKEWPIEIIGGPFDKYVPTGSSFGLCVREERVPNTADHIIPIRDFSIPRAYADVYHGVLKAFSVALKGQDVYVGCMGGWGRTGLILAIMAKVAGIQDPVSYVREEYTPHAVETTEQMTYVANFDVSELQRDLRRMLWLKRFPILRFFWR